MAMWAYSPGYGRTAVSVCRFEKGNGVKPSGVMRIKALRTPAFDPDYYVNFEEIGNRHPIFPLLAYFEDLLPPSCGKNAEDSDSGMVKMPRQ